MKKLLWSILIVLLVVLFDQTTKSWAVSNLADGQSIQLIGQFFMFTLVYNEGGAMGTNFGSPTLYLFLAFIILPFLFYYIYRHRDYLIVTIPMSFIAGGAIGNLSDRIRLGKVVDFLDVDFFDIDLLGFRLNRWWTFNLADLCISCGIIFLVIFILIDNSERKFSDDHTESPPNLGEAEV